MADASLTHNTLAFLKARQIARAAGYPVAYTTDPAWLVTMAINRRAGWPDDPGTSRGSAMPVNGRYPKQADGDTFRWLSQLGSRMNGTRVRIYASEVPLRYRARLAHRLVTRDDN